MALQIPIETLDVPPRLRKLLTEAGRTSRESQQEASFSLIASQGSPTPTS
jgi:hypothetical protein